VGMWINLQPEVLDLDDILKIVNICVLFVLSIVFWLRIYKKSETSAQKWINFSYGWFMMSFGLMNLCYLIISLGRRGIIPVVNYESYYNFWWHCGAALGTAGVLLILFVLERYFVKTYYLLSIFQFYALIFIMIFPAYPNLGYDARLISYIALPTGALGLLVIYFYMIRRDEGSARMKSLGAFLGIFLIFIGYALDTMIGAILFPFTEISILETILMMSGAILISFSKYEVTWTHAMKYLMISRSSVALFDYQFASDKDAQTRDTTLLAGGFSGVIILLKELTKSEQQIKVVDQGDIKVLIEYGKHIIAMLYSTHELKILRDKLRKLVVEVEELYAEILPVWAGNIDIFKPVNSMVERIFQPA
jgi:hypothetical protein